MIYTDLTKKATKLCYEAHKNQFDKSGLPYVLHPIHLAEQMTDEYTTVAALLHDVIEDTDYTIQDLVNMGYPEDVIEALKLLTHAKDEPYMDYIAKIKGNRIATVVKLADLQHNSDLTRIDKIDEKALKRVEKYKRAMSILTDVEVSDEDKTINELFKIITELDARNCSSNCVIPELTGISWDEICNKGIALLEKLKTQSN